MYDQFHEGGTEYQAIIGLPVKRHSPVYGVLLVGRCWPASDVYWAAVKKLFLFYRALISTNLSIQSHNLVNNGWNFMKLIVVIYLAMW